MTAKCRNANIHENGSFKAKINPSRYPPSSSSLRPPAETCCRYWAISDSSAVKKYVPVLDGHFGMSQKAKTTTMRLTMPSIKTNH